MNGAAGVTRADGGLLLGIETAAGLVGVALADESGPLAGAWLRSERRHAETLAPAIAHVLAQAGASPADLAAVAVDVGPGLFTGLRVGVATAQGLAEGLGVGIVAVTSVEVLVREAYDAGWAGPVAAVVDARRGEVFAARCAGPGEVVGAPWRDAPGDLASKLAAPGTLCVGTGAVAGTVAWGQCIRERHGRHFHLGHGMPIPIPGVFPTGI